MLLDRVSRRWFARFTAYVLGAHPCLTHCFVVDVSTLSFHLRSPPTASGPLPLSASATLNDKSLVSRTGIAGP